MDRMARRAKVALAFGMAVLLAGALSGCGGGSGGSGAGQGRRAADSTSASASAASDVSAGSSSGAGSSSSSAASESGPSAAADAAEAPAEAAVDYDAIYDRVLRQALSGEGEFAASYTPDGWEGECYYSTYDIGGDGVPELLVMTGTTTMSSATRAFTVEGGEPVLLGVYDGLLSGWSAGDAAGGLYEVVLRQGIGQVNRLSFEGGEAVRTLLASGDAYGSDRNGDRAAVDDYCAANGLFEIGRTPASERVL